MKKIIGILCGTCLIISCNNEKTADSSGDKKMDSSAKTSYPYKAVYSSDFKMGDPNHSKIVLDFYKAWEENRMDDMRPLLTDSISVEFSDGSKFKGTADSLIKSGKEFRSTYSAVKIDVEAFLPVHSNDQNADYVLIWSSDYTTNKSGKIDSARGHSYFMLKNNKISEWSEFLQKKGVMAPQTADK